MISFVLDGSSRMWTGSGPPSMAADLVRLTRVADALPQIELQSTAVVAGEAPKDLADTYASTGGSTIPVTRRPPTRSYEAEPPLPRQDLHLRERVTFHGTPQRNAVERRRFEATVRYAESSLALLRECAVARGMRNRWWGHPRRAARDDKPKDARNESQSR